MKKSPMAKTSSISRKKLLSKLGQSKYNIRLINHHPTDQWGLYLKKLSGVWSLVSPIDQDTIKQMISDGTVTPSGDRLYLTNAGRMGIKRLLTNYQTCLGQHQDRVETKIPFEGRITEVVIDQSESPLSWLYNRKDKKGQRLIDPHQFRAGERLRSDYERAHLSPQITRNWDHLAMPKAQQNSNPANSSSLTDSIMTARKNVDTALDAVGPGLSDILVDICCDQRGLADAERHLGWPKRSAKVILRMALTRLAQHYGYLTAENNSQRHSHKIFHWGTDDYRPLIDND